ncbi:hypothetical protein FNV43_RR09169 [Rhamnella rubrinervis]|uniref:glyoxylate reductase (NADP(+)) n=1 Tax=Rhamnella rubrinervis TaxID=2594499 RepID=A0A8K0H9I7_9ROSA|nr:hypothetical protein FNV43_RR09169 [Rhamnella rubrinervis]
MADQAGSETNHLPLILVHRLPSFDLALTNILQTHFRILDPLHSSQPLDSFLTSHAQSVRALIVYALSPLTADTIRLLPSLEVVVGTSAGVDHIDISECRNRGITVTNAGDAFAEDVADCAVALLIDVLRRVSAGDRYVRSGLWRLRGEYTLGSKLGGKRVGIVGLGRIGSQVAQRLMAFGCIIAYNSRKKKSSVQYPYYAKVCDLATNSDILMVCCSLTSETHHLINKEVMKALGKEGVIVNVGRGGLVDEQELIQLLTREEIGGAGLDVFEEEPDVPGELFALDNVVLSPHKAVLTPESIEAVFQLSLANLKCFFSNEPLRSVVQQE